MSRDTHKFLCSCICLWVHIKNCQTKFDMDKRKQEIVPKVLQYEIARVFISNVETRSYHIAVSRETKQDTLHCGGQIWWKTAEDPCVKSSLMIFLAISQFLIVELCLPQAREMGTEAGGQVQLLSQVCLCPMPPWQGLLVTVNGNPVDYHTIHPSLPIENGPAKTDLYSTPQYRWEPSDDTSGKEPALGQCHTQFSLLPF